MSSTRTSGVELRHPDRFFIGGAWTTPSTGATFDVDDSATGEIFLTVAEARAADVDRAVTEAHRAFTSGPWPGLTHSERAGYLRAIAAGIRERADEFGHVWTRQSGMVNTLSRVVPTIDAGTFEMYAAMAETFPFEEVARESPGDFGLLVREPVGVVGAIVPWNGPLTLMAQKLAPALLAGCTVVVKSSPEAPADSYLLAEILQSVDLPPGVVNFVTADREVSELLVRDQRVDKITFTGSTAAGRRIASICGERIARCTLELGGKSAAVILEDADIGEVARSLSFSECIQAGQVCCSLTRIIVTADRHDEMVDALCQEFGTVRVGDPFDADTQMGPLVSERQRHRVEGYIAAGIAEGATLATGGGRPGHLDRGWYVEPTVFAHVDNRSTIAQEEIFGPVLSVIAARDDDDAVAKANDTVYGLNASVFTEDVDRARHVASRLRSGTVGHNAFRSDIRIAFGGFKQSGIGREGGTEGLLPYLEAKTVLLRDRPGPYRAG